MRSKAALIVGILAVMAIASSMSGFLMGYPVPSVEIAVRKTSSESDEVGSLHIAFLSESGIGRSAVRCFFRSESWFCVGRSPLQSKCATSSKDRFDDRSCMSYPR